MKRQYLSELGKIKQMDIGELANIFDEYNEQEAFEYGFEQALMYMREYVMDKAYGMKWERKQVYELMDIVGESIRSSENQLCRGFDTTPEELTRCHEVNDEYYGGGYTL